MHNVSRRGLLLGLGGAALGAVGAQQAAAATDMTGQAPQQGQADRRILPFYGRHQMGVVNAPPAAAILASFNILATKPGDLQRLFRLLTDRIAFLMSGGETPALDPKFPPADSGILGTTIVPENLTITVALGASAFDSRFGLQALKPAHLKPMQGFPNDALEASMCHGDLLLQFCADSLPSCIHALRDIIKNTPDLLVLRWKIDGFLPARQPGQLAQTPRNLLGFKDGTGNPDTNDAPLMEQVVWVQPGNGEPAWTAGGSYQVVRLVRHYLERWDRTPLQEQETIFGRLRPSGAPIGQTAEHDEPDYRADPDGKLVPLTSHMRLANARDEESRKHLILRRAFNYSRGVTKAGQLDMGLNFICFQHDLDAGFLYLQDKLNGEPLEEYIKPFGGGYFFVLPGIADQSAYLGQSLLDSL